MVALIFLFLNLVASLFKPKSRLEAENAALRQQLIVLQRKVRGRVQFTNSDRLFFIQLYRWCPSVLKAMMIIRPETLVRWHRAGFRRYWRWKSRSAGGRPQIHAELRALIWLSLLKINVIAVGRGASRNVQSFPSSGSTLIAMVQTANFREGNDVAGRGRLYRTRLRAVLAERKMRSGVMMVLKIAR